ncbi:hypothetical protein MQY53_001613 [Salmonella enterica subsp. enterica]|nr:hypothetical protein [Salmonella enterica subsp. enterica]
MAKRSNNYSSGSRFGLLTIVSESVPVLYGNRWQASFLCRCDCGREEVIPTTKLLKRSKKNQGCDICVRGPCVVCGKSIPDNRSRSNTCCDACETQKKRHIQLSHYINKSAEPGYNQRRYKSARAREDSNPELREKRLARQKQYSQLPARRSQQREYHRKRYAEMKDFIQAIRRRIFEQMSPEEQDRIRDLRRTYNREYRRRFREFLRHNPELQVEFKEKMRLWQLERARRIALAELIADSQKLLDKKS